MSAWRLLLTRPAEVNPPLAAALDTVGVVTASLPLLELQPLAETPEQRSLWLDLDRYAAVLVVSKPAARLGLAALDQYWPQPPLQAWFAVGAATAAVLEDYGLQVHHPQREDSEGLLALPALQEALERPEPEVLLLRGEGGRDLLVDTLTARGARVEVLELYRRQCPDYRAGPRDPGSGPPECHHGQQWAGFRASAGLCGCGLARGVPLSSAGTQRPCGRTGSCQRLRTHHRVPGRQRWRPDRRAGPSPSGLTLQGIPVSETQAPRADDVSPDPVVTPASPPPAPPPASVRRKGSGKASGLALLALLVAAGGLGVGGWSVWQLQQVRQAEQGQAAQAEDLRSQLRQLEMRNQALSADLGRLPSANELEERRRQLGELQGDQQHLAEQFKEVVGQSRQAWRLTEAEHLLRMATLRMTALQDVPSAQNLLQGVDDILKAQNDPAAFAARQQLANAQQTLRQLPDLDRTGQFVQLASLRNQVQSLEPLPPRFSTTVADQPGVEKAALPPSNALQQWWQDFRQRISSYFRIDFSADQPIRPLLAEESLAQVRLAMSLALEQAQWAVLNGNQEVYRLSIEQAEDVLAAHFNNQNPDSRAVKLRLQELAERPVTFEAPDLTPALTALQAYIAQRQQIQPNNAAAGAAQENRP